jgi:hypothetical protein
MADFTSVEGGAGGFLVAQVLSYATNEAQTRSEAAEVHIDGTVERLDDEKQTLKTFFNGQWELDKILTPALNLPSLTDPLDPDEERARFTQMVNQTANEIATGFTSYLNAYFPLGDELALASAWVRRALTTGGTGINTNVERALWARERDRVLADQQRAEEEVTALWASRRYPMPPGAALHAVQMLQKDGQDKIAQASRDAAIKSFETEIENVRFAVGKAIELREAAIRTALQYITALVLEPRKLALELTMGLAELEVKVAELTTEYYRAQLAAAEVPLKIATTKDEFEMKRKLADLGAQLDILLKGRTEATLSAAKMQATQAAALLNGIHGQASFSSSESI